MRVFFVIITVVLLLLVGSSAQGSGCAQDLKKISGLDYKKIEARKELLACM